MTIGPKTNPRPLILHVDSDTSIPYRLAESDSLYIGSLSANDYSNLNISGIGGFPSQDGNSGKYLTTNGTTLSWAAVTGASNYTIITKTTGGTPLTGDGTEKVDQDPDLYLPMLANTKYSIKCNLFAHVSATGSHQFKFGLYPATDCSAIWSLITISPVEGDTAKCGTYTVTGYSGYYNLGNTTGYASIIMEGTITNGSINNALYAGYGVGTTSNIRILSGSYLHYREAT